MEGTQSPKDFLFPPAASSSSPCRAVPPPKSMATFTVRPFLSDRIHTLQTKELLIHCVCCTWRPDHFPGGSHTAPAQDTKEEVNQGTVHSAPHSRPPTQPSPWGAQLGTRNSRDGTLSHVSRRSCARPPAYHTHFCKMNSLVTGRKLLNLIASIDVWVNSILEV